VELNLNAQQDRSRLVGVQVTKKKTGKKIKAGQEMKRFQCQFRCGKMYMHKKKCWNHELACEQRSTVTMVTPPASTGSAVSAPEPPQNEQPVEGPAVLQPAEAVGDEVGTQCRFCNKSYKSGGAWLSNHEARCALTTAASHSTNLLVPAQTATPVAPVHGTKKRKNASESESEHKCAQTLATVANHAASDSTTPLVPGQPDAPVGNAPVAKKKRRIASDSESEHEPPEAPSTSDVTSAWPTVGDVVWVWDEQTTNRRKHEQPVYRTFEGTVTEIDEQALKICRCKPDNCPCTPFRLSLNNFRHTYLYGRDKLFRTKEAALTDMHNNIY
jgi:hypothetical protein